MCGVSKRNIMHQIEQNPIIAAIREEKDLDDAIRSEVGVIFLLHADIFSIKSLVEKVKAAGKSVLIHIDFLEGIGKDQKAIDYISEVINPDGIITTRSNHIKYSMEKGLFVIQRFFLIDSQSFDITVKTVQSLNPDMIEIMPGIIPSVINSISHHTRIPIIAGGLISTKEEIMEILNAGALGVSTGKKELWGL